MTNKPTDKGGRGPLIGLAVMLAATAAVCIWYGVTDHGIYHPDEVYQTLEPAHRLFYGWGLEAWEWEIGARNYTLPALLAPLFGLAELLGLTASPAHLLPVTVFVSSLTAAAGAGVYRLARNYEVRPVWGLVGAGLFALAPATLYLGHRPLAEVISTPFVAWGLALIMGPRAPGRREGDRGRLWRLVGLSLVGLSVLLRLQNALFCLVLAALYRFGGAEEDYHEAMRVFAAWGLLYGLVDWVTWGLPYQSAGAYLRFNLIMGGTTDYYGFNSVATYAAALVRTNGPAALVLGASVVAWRRASRLWIVVGVFLLAHHLFPHKQLRFIYPALPLLGALTAVGLDDLQERFDLGMRGAGGLAVVVLVATVGWGSYALPRLTFGDLRQAGTMHLEADRSAHRYHHSLNVLLGRAGARQDLCGLHLRQAWAVRAGGLSYLHRDVPVYHRLNPPKEAGLVNYAIEPERGGATGAEVVDRVGAWRLVRLSDGPCERDPDYRPHVFAYSD